MSILFMTEAILFFGWVAEWSNAPVSKTGIAATLSWVQIPPHPPIGGVLAVLSLWHKSDKA